MRIGGICVGKSLMEMIWRSYSRAMCTCDDRTEMRLIYSPIRPSQASHSAPDSTITSSMKVVDRPWSYC